MQRLTMIAAYGLFLTPMIAHAQEQPAVADVVQDFAERGLAASISPTQAFVGCPDRTPWQLDLFSAMSTAQFSPAKERDLALMWTGALKVCRDPTLAQWYFVRLRAAAARGESGAYLFSYWEALKVDMPEIRTFLFDLTEDPSQSDELRNVAGTVLFQRFTPIERQQEFMRLFERKSVPFELAIGQVPKLVAESGDAFLAAVASAVRARPDLAVQPAMTQIVADVHGRGGERPLRELEDALDHALMRAEGSDRDFVE